MPKDHGGPGGRDDKGKSVFPPTHCAEIGVVGSIPTHGQLAVPRVYLCENKKKGIGSLKPIFIYVMKRDESGIDEEQLFI